MVFVICTGCATQGTNSFNYVPSSSASIQNEKTFARPQAAIWDELVRELSKSFFVINNIERESRIINVSFNSNSPTDFVDCGRSERTYTQGDKTERFDYDIAGASTYKIAMKQQEHPSFSYYAVIRRETSLEGRSNIYVAPDPSDNSKTVVSVNTRYILTIRVKGDQIAEHANGNRVSRGRVSENTTTRIFNTNKPSSETSFGVTTVCHGNGKLETDVIKLIR